MTSAYKSYEVGYFGDHAGVRCELTTPIHGTSSKPKDKMNRQSYEVITTHQQFNSATIGVAVKDALASKDYATYVTLLNAQFTLSSFVAANGATNPDEAADWDDDATATTRVPVMA